MGIRISIVGSPGSGKSTLARSLHEGAGVPYLELDSVVQGPNWQMRPAEVVSECVMAFCAAHDTWVIDGNYGSIVQSQVWGGATLVVWLDLPRWRVMTRVLWRSIRRLFGRKVLWNGNRERLSKLLSPNPEENIILWTWRQFAHYRDRYTAALADPTWPHLTFVRLENAHEVDRWLTTFCSDYERATS